MKIGTSLQSLRRARAARQLQGGTVRPGAEKVRGAASTTVAAMMIQIAGIWYPIFQPGLHSPDDTSVTRYVL
jgi:hypothetical protein